MCDGTEDSRDETHPNAGRKAQVMANNNRQHSALSSTVSDGKCKLLSQTETLTQRLQLWHKQKQTTHKAVPVWFEVEANGSWVVTDLHAKLAVQIPVNLHTQTTRDEKRTGRV